MSGRKVAMIGSRAEDYQQAASELLNESLDRGDQDAGTVAWAVHYLLLRAADINSP